MPNPTPTLKRIETICGIGSARAYTRHTLLTADECLAALADKIGGVIVHRINFPKVLAGKVSRKASLNAKVRPLLSPDEVADAKQATALALVATGALQRGKLTFGDWKVAFRAVRGADCLRIDRRAKNLSEIISIDSLTSEETDFAAVRDGFPALPEARRRVIARKVRYTRAQCFAAFGADTSRNAASNLRKALRFVTWLCSQYRQTGKGIAEMVNSESGDADAMLKALRMRKARFADYIAKGEAILTADALASVLAKVERELRSFADIPENYAIAA